MVIAAWMRYVTAIDERGGPIDVRDPMTATLAATVARSGPAAPQLVPALFGLTSVFGDLGQNPVVVQTVTKALESIYARGAAGAAERAA